MYKFIAFLLLLSSVQLCAQEQTNNHFLVEFDKFTPPTKDLVSSFEGKRAEPFMANDVTGVQQFLGDYKGKKVILWFWSIDSDIAKEQMSAMMLLEQRNSDMKLVSFAQEPKAKVQEYLRQNPVDFTVIPNGELFGQMAYGADLGSPRMFIIDQSGVIKAVLPQEAFADNSKLLVSLESILGGM